MIAPSVVGAAKRALAAPGGVYKGIAVQAYIAESTDAFWCGTTRQGMPAQLKASVAVERGKILRGANEQSPVEEATELILEDTFVMIGMACRMHDGALGILFVG